MKYILIILAILSTISVAKAGNPYYYYYVQPEFYVAPQIIPVVVNHKNFIDHYTKKQVVEKTEIFAPIIIEQHSFYFKQSVPSHPNFRR